LQAEIDKEMSQLASVSPSSGVACSTSLNLDEDEALQQEISKLKSSIIGL